MNITTATFDNDSFTSVYGVWQWDYGQILRIEGLQLPPVVEVHFSLQEKSGEVFNPYRNHTGRQKQT